MSLPSGKDPELIFPELYFLIIDNKKARKFVTLEMGKVKLSKKILTWIFSRIKN